MTISSTERKIRSSLRVIRVMQSAFPPNIANRFNKMGASRVRLDSDITQESILADGVPCDWIIPPDHNPEKVLLYLHGGGFVFGQTPLHLQMGGYLARRLGFRLLMVDYRTAPEHPFPAALDDCVTAYQWLFGQGIAPRNIIIAGDSAGGNLTLATILKLRAGGHPLPAAAVCLSPVTDLTPKAHRREGFTDPLLSPKAMKFYTQAYLGDNDPYNPLISPVLGDLRGLPPTLIFAGEDEILREDAIHFAEVAKAAGVDVRLEIYPHMWHVWQLFLALPEARQSLDDMAEFCRKHLATETS